MGAATASGDGRAQEAIRKALDSPLLNDNKITGAKNVLLLIVSGDQEITIDEIGDINDHIQEQAGFGANIIMGVGEDLNLEDSVSVTIIATGFNADQQNEITNIEPEKIIHSLEEDNLFNQKPLKNDISTEEIEEESEDKIVHVLDEEPIGENDLEDEINEIKSINDIEVIDFTHVVDEKENLIENEVVNEIDIDSIDQEETENSINWSLFDKDKEDNLSGQEKINEAIDVNEIEVIDYIELIPTEEKNEIGEVIHEMEDHMLFEPLSELSENSTLVENSDIVETEVEAEVKEEIVSEIPTSDEEIDPLNTSIEDLQKQRSKERRLRMKEFNYKFNNSKIDEIEKEPAYKRRGVDLEETKHSSEEERSRFTLDLDENEDIQLRKNNSFLHDNVD